MSHVTKTSRMSRFLCITVNGNIHCHIATKLTCALLILALHVCQSESRGVLVYAAMPCDKLEN